ncbi:putative arf-GAP with GTPase [Triplophysa rosa]|uniref:Arf-GAP with GTPase n=1 Tax=Triplophysa rosa TaxID=992332 RepID=A0A9W7TE44_TRIRA|nr:putative arf-GAP with GTPase [Triplophysa rosa]
MNSTIKVTNSTAIRAEVKRHESLQNTLNKFLRQLEKVEDPQIRTGLKVFLHSIQVIKSIQVQFSIKPTRQTNKSMNSLIILHALTQSPTRTPDERMHRRD